MKQFERIFCTLSLLFPLLVSGQSGSVDTTFNPNDPGRWNGDGPTQGIITVGIQSSGKVIIGGNFEDYNGNTSWGLARLNTDGSFDNTFYNDYSNRETGKVYAVKVQPDDKVIVAGTIANVIIRKNADGKQDNTFRPGKVAYGGIKALALQSDGKIFIGGDFTQVSGVSSRSIARLNSDGSLDTSFKSGTGFSSNIGAGVNINAITIQQDGKILVGGTFTAFNDVAVRNIVRLNSNGSLDTSFHTGTGIDYTVYAVAVQKNRILVGGDIYKYNGTSIRAIIPLKYDVTIDSSFKISSVNVIIYGFGIQPDGKILAVGQFISGSYTKNIIRLMSDGRLDSNFNSSSTNSDGVALAMALQKDGKILLAGGFTKYNGIGHPFLVRTDTLGEFDYSFNAVTGANGGIAKVLVQPDGKILACGNFQMYNGKQHNFLIRADKTGRYDSTFRTSGTGPDNVITGMALQPDGRILISGSFTHYDGVTRYYIARLYSDGRLDATFDPGGGVDGSVTAFSIQKDGKIIVSGTFTKYNGKNAFGIVRLNNNGTLDNTFITGTGIPQYQSISQTLLQPDGKLLIAGAFDSYNGKTVHKIARLNTDGTLDNTFSSGQGPNTGIGFIALLNDGKIIAQGLFSTFDGYTRNNIVRLNSNGSVDTTYKSNYTFRNWINAMALQPDQKLLLAGNATTVSDLGGINFIRLNADGSFDSSFSAGWGANDLINSIALQSDGKIIIGGAFTYYHQVGRNRIARIINCTGIKGNTISGSQEICFHTAPADIASDKPAEGGDSTFTYLWQYSRDSVNFQSISGSSGMTYNPGVMDSTAWYRRIAVSGSGCGSVISNTVKIKVKSPVTGNFIQGAQTLCYADSATLIKTREKVSGDSIVFQWQSSVDNIHFTAIKGADNEAYAPSVKVGKTYYRRLATEVSGCGSDTSNTLSVTRYPQIDTNSNKIGNSQSICISTAPELLKSVVAPAGGNDTFFYQWQMAADSANGIYKPIPSATNQDYQPGILMNATWFRRVAASKCGFLYSNIVQISVLDTCETGISHADNQPKFSLSPNPAGNQLQIECTGDNCSQKLQLSIISIDGKTLLRDKWEGEKIHTLDLSALCPGIYEVRISNGTRQYTQTLIRK
jgi:uncharacterized delta-60 repeat protein